MIILIANPKEAIEATILKSACSLPEKSLLVISPNVYLLRTCESPQTLSKKIKDALPGVPFFMFTSPSTDWIGHPNSEINSWISECLSEQVVPLMS